MSNCVNISRAQAILYKTTVIDLPLLPPAGVCSNHRQTSNGEQVALLCRARGAQEEAGPTWGWSKSRGTVIHTLYSAHTAQHLNRTECQGCALVHVSSWLFGPWHLSVGHNHNLQYPFKHSCLQFITNVSTFKLNILLCIAKCMYVYSTMY